MREWWLSESRNKSVWLCNTWTKNWKNFEKFISKKTLVETAITLISIVMSDMENEEVIDNTSKFGEFTS